MTNTLLYAIGTASPILSVGAIVWMRMRFNAEHVWMNMTITSQDRALDRLRGECNIAHELIHEYEERIADFMAEKVRYRARLSEAGRKGALIGNRSPKRKGAKGNV